MKDLSFLAAQKGNSGGSGKNDSLDQNIENGRQTNTAADEAPQEKYAKHGGEYDVVILNLNGPEDQIRSRDAVQNDRGKEGIQMIEA